MNKPLEIGKLYYDRMDKMFFRILRFHKNGETYCVVLEELLTKKIRSGFVESWAFIENEDIIEVKIEDEALLKVLYGE